MKDLFDYIGKADALCVTTNGWVGNSGRCVMGRGVALSAKQRFKGIDLKLGKLIQRNGNICQTIMKESGTWIVAFPVKPVSEIMSDTTELVDHKRGMYRLGDVVPGWSLKAQIPVIEKSAKELMGLVRFYEWVSIIMTKPGCYNGALDWESEVKPVLSGILDERVTIL